MENRYGFGKSVPMNFEQAMAKVAAQLQKERIGVLTGIELAASMYFNCR